MLTKIKNILINIAVMLLSTVLTLILLELIIAIFFQQKILKTASPEAFYINYDSGIGWVNKKNISGNQQRTYSERPVFIRTNEYGMRGGPVLTIKPDGIKRVMILGDSNAFGYGLQEEEIFATLLSKRLPTNYQVLNSGVFGYGTDQSLLLFERDGLKFRPDIVVLAFSAGDPSDNMNSINTGSAKPYFKLVNDHLVLKNTPVPRGSIYRKSESRESAIKNALYSYSNLYRLIFNRLVATNIFAPKSVQEMSREEGLSTTMAIISSLDDVCRSNGCRLVVLLISHEELVAAQSRIGMEVGYYPIIKNSLDSIGIPYIDPTQELVNQYFRGKDVFLKNDPVHINALGNEIVANVIYQWISDNFLKQIE